MMAILADVPIVVFVTGKADRVWIAGNNDKIRALPAAYPNVTVLDWEVIGPQCPGDCFYDDQIHLDRRRPDLLRRSGRADCSGRDDWSGGWPGWRRRSLGS